MAASSVPIAVGWRNGNALLLRSSDSPGTSSTFKVVSVNRSRTVFRSSREVRRRAGITPAAFGSGGPVVDPPLPVETLPAVPVMPPPPDIPLALIDPSHATPSRLAPQIPVIKI